MTAFLSVLVLAGTLAMPAAPSAPAPRASAPAARPGGATKSLCIADCGNLNSNVSCSGNVCSAVNQSQTCPSEPGHVTCDGQTFYCAACCTSGTFRSVITGPYCSCADGQTTPRDRYECIDGLWEYQYSYCGGPFCQGF
jgi:hypothetical protein